MISGQILGYDEEDPVKPDDLGTWPGDDSDEDSLLLNTSSLFSA